MNAIFITSDGEITVMGHPADESEQYQNVKKGIGCSLIERVRFNFDSHPCEMWVDEEGLLKGALPYNSVASNLASAQSVVFLVGNAVVTGPDLSPLTSEVSDAILEWLTDL